MALFVVVYSDVCCNYPPSLGNVVAGDSFSGDNDINSDDTEDGDDDDDDDDDDNDFP